MLLDGCPRRKTTDAHIVRTEASAGTLTQSSLYSKGRRYFLADAALAAADCCCFALAAPLAFTSFCEDFFWFALGDLSPMILFGWSG